MLLNDLTKKDSYASPEMKRVIEATAGSKYITVLDLNKRYF
jgi:hypothetical protein